MQIRLDLTDYIDELPLRGSRRTYEITPPPVQEELFDEALSSGYVEAKGEELRILPDGIKKKINPETDQVTYRVRVQSDWD